MWLLAFNPWPPHNGGKLRVWALIAGLAGNDLHITVSYAQTAGDETPPALPNVTWKPYHGRSRATLVDKLVSTASRYPEGAWEVSSRARREWVDSHAHEFDVVILEQPHVSTFVAAVRNIPVKVVIAQNVEHVLVRQLASSLPRLRSRLRYRLDALKYQLLERRLFRWADLVTAVSEDDAARIRRMSPTPVVVRPNGVDLDEFSYADPTADRANDVVLTGTLGYLPNLDAATWTAQQIWPLVRLAVPDANFYLVGANCPPELAALHAPEDGFHVVGFVDDVIPYLRRARVFMMPLRMGSGTRLKALQAMAAGCPLVSTALGVEGLGAGRAEVWIGKDAEELAAGTVALLLDDQVRVEQARKARRFVAATYSWDGIVADYRADLGHAVARTASSPHQGLL